VASGADVPRAGWAEAPSAPERGLSTPVLVALIWLFGASACLLLYLGSKLTFFLDDWTFLLYRPGFGADAILAPHGEHIVVIPAFVYQALQETIGMGSAFPFRVISTALFLTSAALLFVFLRRRVGQWPALAATAVVLFLGAAWEDLLWPFQMGYFGCMAAGLGALLALERGSRRGDALACLLLAVAILFSSLGLSFAIGAAVAVLISEDRWRRAYVFVVPFAIYGLWWLGWGHDAESAVSLTNAGRTPLYVLNGLASSVGSALGLSNHAVWAESDKLAWLRPLTVALGGLAVWRIYRLGGAPRGFWVVLAVGISFWTLAGLNQMPGREPDASRYQYVGVVFLLLIAAELLRGVEIGRTATIVLFVVAGCSIASNVQNLISAYDDTYRPIAQLEKADLAALDIVRDTVEPGFVLSEDIADTGFVHVEAGRYLEAREQFGTPAYSEAELVEAAGFARFAADKVLFNALGIELEPGPEGAVPESAPAATDGPEGVLAVATGECATVPSDGAVTPLVALPPAGAEIRAGASPVGNVSMDRFSSGEFPIVMTEGVPASRVATLAIPPDRSSVPWKVLLETASPAVICGREEGGES
jgi:hypothetical protein